MTQGFPDRLFRLCTPIVLAVLLQRCEESRDEAHVKLYQVQYQFTPFSFLQDGSERDHVAVTLLILAGVEPNTVLDCSVVKFDYLRLLTGSPEAWRRFGEAWPHDRPCNGAAILGHAETFRALLEAGNETPLVKL